MAENGVQTPNLTSVSSADEFIVNKDGSTARVSFERVASQVRASFGPTYETKAELDADLSWAAGTLGVVWNDSTGANNGDYVKSGAAGSGGWSKTGSSAIGVAVAKAEAWAEQAENVEVETGKYSAKHHALQAAASASDAAVADAGAQAALTQATLAAQAAGAPLFDSLANGLAGTANGDVFMVIGELGTAVYRNDSGTETFLGWLSQGTVYNIKSWGARGGYDSTSHIQAALDAAGATSDWTVVLVPPSDDGSPYLFSELQVGSKTVFMSTGGMLKLKDAVCTDTGTNYYPINNLGATDTWFKDLLVDGNGANNTAFNVADAITCVGENSRVTGCVIWDAPDSGIMFSAAKSGMCADNRINGATDTCIYVNADEGTDGLYGAIIRGNICTGGVYGGINIKRGSAHIVVANNTIRECGNAITFEEFGVGNGGTPGPMIIEGNLARDIGYMYRSASPSPAETGLNLQLAENVTVRGNQFYNVSGPIIGLDGATGCIVEGNICTGYRTDPATAVYGNVGLLVKTRDGVVPENNVIANNVIRGVADEGMYLQEGTGNVLTSNAVYDTQTTFQAIRIEAAFDGNVVIGNALNGNSIDMTIATGAADNIITMNRQANGTGVAASGLRRSTAVTTPIGNFTPLGAGEVFHITTGDKIFMATGTTDTSWVELSHVPTTVIRNGAISTPVGNVTPTSVGELYNTTSGGEKLWISTGTADTDWAQLV